VEYHAVNLAMVKNRYPLPSMLEMLHCVGEARIFTKLDLRGAYTLIRIKTEDDYKMAIRTRYGQFEYWVMPFGLTNTPATFQCWIDDSLQPYIDHFAVCYLDDIEIYSTNEMEHEEHVRHVPRRLTEFGLYCTAEKGQFVVSEVGILGFVITPEGVGVQWDQISTIEDSSTPKSI